MPPVKDARTRILICAYDLFTRRSYARVPVDEIAKCAKVSKGGLFHHFESKYVLARECIAFALQDILEGEFQKRARRTKDPEARVKLFLDLTVEQFAANTKILMLIVDVYEEGVENDDDLDVWKDLYRGFTADVETLLADCSVSRPKEKARILMAALDGLAIQVILLDEISRSRELGRVKTELLRMVLDRPAPSSKRGVR